VISGFEYALSEDGGNAAISALKYFFMASLAPFLIALSVMVLVAFTLAFAAVAIAITVIPLRFQAYLDGVAGMVGLILIFEAIGLSSPVHETFGSVGTVAFYWAIMISTSAFIWSRLPFGFRYQGTANRVVGMSLDEIADRLIPGRAPELELADISLLNRPIETGEGEVYVRSEPDQERGRLSFELYQEGTGHFVQSQTMRYVLIETAPGETVLYFAATLTGLSPMSLWDFWNRPFTEDYADHIVARLVNSKDRSTYGRMQSAVRRKKDKEHQKQAAA
ncbi:MAG: hypothetical protein KJN60_14435, partial [Boseongicola sp.]|nr:hypothetical protein [Boseongicola sp.]